MKQSSIVTLDIGGTKINAGRYRNGGIEYNVVVPFDGKLSVTDSVAFIVECIEQIQENDTCAIAIGVPSIVDIEQGIVFDAVNIGSWQALPLKDMLQTHFNVPVYINNDVNCFTVGEHLTRVGQGYNDMLGLCLGTGIGAGIIFQGKLYTGANCCAGEVGSFSYLNGTIDDYCSGQFFIDHYQETGEQLAVKAKAGDSTAQQAFIDFAQHLAQAINHLLLIVDPKIIVIGGSVAQSFDLFIDSLWQNLTKFPYQKVIENLVIEQSTEKNSALLGAVHLYLESIDFQR
jgi:glucokinase